MSPILTGVVASGISGHLTSPTSYDSIQTVTLSTATTYIDFTSIPSTYKHLEIRWMAQSSATADYETSAFMQFNGDTAYNYSSHYFGANQVPANYTYGYYTGIYAPMSNHGGLNTYGNNTYQFTGAVLNINNYAATDKYKTTQSISGVAAYNNTYSYIYRTSHNWRSTSAITSIRFAPVSASWAANTTVALYGIKG